MTIYDAVMVCLVVAGMIWGAFRGITWQLASIGSLVLGYVVAFPASGELARHFPGEAVVARALAMLVVYVVVSGGVFGVAWLVRTTLRKLKFEAYDRHLGMLLGGAEGALLGTIGTLFVLSLAPQARNGILTSYSGTVVSTVLNAVQPALPGEIRTVLAPFWNAPSGESQGAPASMPESDRNRVALGPSEVMTGWVNENKSKVGRAVANVVEGQIEQLGENHGRPSASRR